MEKFFSKYAFFILVLIFFLLRLSNLTLLPIFNDEAIYLHWGLKEVQTGDLYYSLYDSKQPLLMWIFAIAASFTSDPLWGARLVSVAFGGLGLLGLFMLGKKFFSRNVGLLAASLYLVIPIFYFYDRQALMESAIGAVGVWFTYFALHFLQKLQKKYAIYTGIIAGIGEFIKSSSLLFVAALGVLFLLGLFFTNANLTQPFPKRRGEKLINLGYLLVSMCAVDGLLLINPMFWQTLSSNNRYSLTLNELIHGPILIWWNNLVTNGEIMFFYLTPLIMLAIIWGIRRIWVVGDRENKVFLCLSLLPIMLETLLSRGSTQRYLVSFLPLLTILAAIGINSFIRLNWGYWGNWAKKGVVVLSVVLAISITVFQVVSPVGYFQFYSHLTRWSDIEGYLMTQNSGEGINQVINLLQQKSSSNPIIVATAVNTGNPEDAVAVYFFNNQNVKFIYLDNRFTGNQLNGIDCLQSSEPLYFISRDEQQGGMNQYLQQIKSIHNPYGKNRIGIYTLKQKCKGKTLRLD